MISSRNFKYHIKFPLYFHFTFRIVAGPRKDDTDEQGDEQVFADITNKANKQLFKTAKKSDKLTEAQPDDDDDDDEENDQNLSKLPNNFKKVPVTE